MQTKILISAATQSEINKFISRFPFKQIDNYFYYRDNQYDITILISGIGVPATTYWLTKTLLKHDYDLVVNAGIAGSFKEEIPMASVVQVVSDCFADIGVDNRGEFNSIFELELADNNHFPFIDGRLIVPNIQVNLSGIALRQVSGITVNTTSGSALKISQLTNKYNPDIETMEGASVLYVSMNEGVSCLQIRAISNYVEPRNRKNWNIELATTQLSDALYSIITQNNITHGDAFA